MSALRHWARKNIARLDGARERRIVALGAMALFLALLFGPWLLNTVDAFANPVALTIQDIGAAPISGPIVLRATGTGAVFTDVEFLITPDNGAALSLPAMKTGTTDDPSTWIRTDMIGEPGRAYSVTARGMAAAAGTVAPIVQANTIHFTVAPLTNIAATDNIAGATSTSGTASSGTSPSGNASTGATSVTRFAEIVAIGLMNPAGNSVRASGVQSDFAPASASFHAESGTTFSQDFAAARGTDGIWRADFELPPGKTYEVRLVVLSTDGLIVRSPSRQVEVPAAASPSAPTAPAVAPSLEILLPAADASRTGPVDMAARISNTTAVGLIFEIRDEGGAIRNLQAADPDGDGVWTGLFEGVPGGYVLSVRASLSNGFVQSFTEHRGFRILPPVEPSAASGTGTQDPMNAAATSTATSAPHIEQPPTAATPAVQLLAPSEQSAPFEGPVPLYAQVKDGVSDQVVFVIQAETGGETLVFGEAATNGVWRKSFDGPDGVYGVRARARVGGIEVFSDRRRFALKRIAAPQPAATAPTREETAPPTPAPKIPPAPAPASIEPAARTPEAPRAAAESPEAPKPERTSSAPAAPAALPESFALECGAAGISAERCADWLKAKYASDACLEAGASTREECASLLRKENLPVDERAMLGLASRQDVEQARAEAAAHYNETVTPDQMPPAVERLLAFTPLPDEHWRMMPSRVVTSATDTAPALLTLDSDSDGLPDDVERRLGTDPFDPDTDHDGFSDGVETKNGYNPLGEGALQRPLRGVDKAMTDGKAIEEPNGEGATVDGSFSIVAAPADSGSSTAPIRLSGKAAPNSVVAIFVYSYLPIVVTTTTGADGSWKYDFSSRLADGRHEAYVSVNDDTGKLVAASSPLSFFVKEAQAVSETDFLRPDVNVQAPAANGLNWFLLGGGFLIVIALVLVALIVRQTRKDPMEPGETGPGAVL